jgi:hypothetical protein
MVDQATILGRRKSTALVKCVRDMIVGNGVLGKFTRMMQDRRFVKGTPKAASCATVTAAESDPHRHVCTMLYLFYPHVRKRTCLV